LEYWKRKNITLAYQWSCLDFEQEDVTENLKCFKVSPKKIKLIKQNGNFYVAKIRKDHGLSSL
jgi:hypothetical protein